MRTLEIPGSKENEGDPRRFGYLVGIILVGGTRWKHRFVLVTAKLQQYLAGIWNHTTRCFMLKAAAGERGKLEKTKDV